MHLAGDGSQCLIFLAQLISQRCNSLLHLILSSPQIAARKKIMVNNSARRNIDYSMHVIITKQTAKTITRHFKHRLATCSLDFITTATVIRSLQTNEPNNFSAKFSSFSLRCLPTQADLYNAHKE